VPCRPPLFEPPHVGLTMDTPALLASIARFGRIIAPLGITAADVTLEGVPSHVRPGQTLQLRLALGARHAEQSTEELEVSLGALAAASRCEVTLCSGTDTSAQMAALLIPSPTTRCVQVSMAVPLECRPRLDSHCASIYLRPSCLRRSSRHSCHCGTLRSAATERRVFRFARASLLTGDCTSLGTIRWPCSMRMGLSYPALQPRQLDCPMYIRVHSRLLTPRSYCWGALMASWLLTRPR